MMLGFCETIPGKRNTPTIEIDHQCQLGDLVPPTPRYPSASLAPRDWHAANIKFFSTFPPYTID